MVGLAPLTRMPPPTGALPPVTVKPSSTLAGPSPAAKVTTEPMPVPRSTVSAPSPTTSIALPANAMSST